MYSNVLSIIVAVFTISISILIIAIHIFYAHEVWGKKHFKASYGATLDGYIVQESPGKSRPQHLLIMFPIAFYLRRLIFIVVVIWMKSFVCQVLVMLAITMLWVSIMLY